MNQLFQVVPGHAVLLHRIISCEIASEGRVIRWTLHPIPTQSFDEKPNEILEEPIPEFMTPQKFLAIRIDQFNMAMENAK